MVSPDKATRVAESPAERFERVVKTVEERQKRAEEKRQRDKEAPRSRVDKAATSIP